MQEAKCTWSTVSEDKAGLGILGIADELPCLAATLVGHMGTSMYVHKTVPDLTSGLQPSPLAQFDCSCNLC